jgi:hypothetical protein
MPLLKKDLVPLDHWHVFPPMNPDWPVSSGLAQTRLAMNGLDSPPQPAYIPGKCVQIRTERTFPKQMDKLYSVFPKCQSKKENSRKNFARFA